MIAAFQARYDLILSPVTSTPPPPLGVVDPAGRFDPLRDFFRRYTNYTPLQDIAGTPAITLPLAHAGAHSDRGRARLRRRDGDGGAVAPSLARALGAGARAARHVGVH